MQCNVTYPYFLQQFGSMNVHHYARAGEYMISGKMAADCAKFFMMISIEPSELFSRV